MTQRNSKGQFVKGYTLTKEERKLLSQIAKKNNFGQWMKGKKLSKETKEKLSQLKVGKNNSFYGKHHTQETIEKNRQAHLGNKYHWKGGKPKCIDCGKELANRYAKRCVKCNAKNRIGKKLSLELREKLSERAKGCNGSNWKGGISSINERARKGIEFSLWREAVFARDNWTCQKCGIRGGQLHPHHIKSFAEYPDLRFGVDNGVTLCETCHRKTDNYGNKENKSMILESVQASGGSLYSAHTTDMTISQA